MESIEQAARRLLAKLDARRDTVAERRQCPAKIQTWRPRPRCGASSDNRHAYVARSGLIVAANGSHDGHERTTSTRKTGTDTGHNSALTTALVRLYDLGVSANVMPIETSVMTAPTTYR
jgi:hypothetical protein